MKRRVTACLITLLSFANSSSHAQKAVLVKIASQKTRIEYFEKNGDSKSAKELRKDIADFEDHFDFCPVYYFIDTNIRKVLETRFDGILLDKDLKPVTTSVLNNGQTEFLIVFYGKPDDIEVNRVDSTSYISGRYPNDGLVVLGHDLRRMPKLDHFIFQNHPFRGGVMKPYFYSSKHFDLEYEPSAADLQKNLYSYSKYLKRKSSRI